MGIVNFAVPKALEKKVDRAIKERGFASKAEFWRTLATNFLDDKFRINEDAYTKYLVQSISRLVEEKFHGKKIPSIEAQLADLK